jgi:hypothetical protein
MDRSDPLSVGPCTADPGRFHLPAGRRPQPVLDRAAGGEPRQRRLNAATVRRQLGLLPDPGDDVLIEAIDDISGSMTGGNDALGLRHEALLIFLEHVIDARCRRRGGRGRPSWYFQCRTFDNGGTCLDIERVELTPSSLGKLRNGLLGPTYGGSSNLGLSLRASIGDATGWKGKHLRVVLSDFELFDSSVPDVLEELASAPANVNLALVFRSPVPPTLDATRVQVHPVSSDTDSPEAVAMLIRDAVNGICGIPKGPVAAGHFSSQ